MDRLEMLLSGAGGQGLILAGIILAEAVVTYTDKNAIQTQSYGPEARGGASRAEVIVDSLQIDYPKVTKPDLLLSLTREAYNKYSPSLKEYGTLIVDAKVQIASRPGPTYKVPIVELATKEIGKSIVANIVSLGLINRLIKIVSDDDLTKAVLKRVPPGTEAINQKALELGFRLGDDLEQYQVQLKEEEGAE